MKFFKLICLTLFFNTQVRAQNLFWTNKVINDILELKLPVNFKTTKESYITTLSGTVKNKYYAVTSYDTTLEKTPDLKAFQTSLTRFYKGLLIKDTARYTTSFREASVGGTNGIMAYLRAKKKSEKYKQKYFYVTFANQRFYLFEIFDPSSRQNLDDVHFFFDAVKFSPGKIEETFLK
ncbi:MAG: hypothetical protein QM737_21915 [Ferruginibacter sp.]